MFRLGWVGTEARPTSGLVITLRAYEVYKALSAVSVGPTLQVNDPLLTLGEPIRSTDSAYRGGVAQTGTRVMQAWTQTITLPAGFTSPGSADFQTNWPDRGGVRGSWQYTLEIAQRTPSSAGETEDDNPHNALLMANRPSTWGRTEPLVNRWTLWDNSDLDNNVVHRQYGSLPALNYPSSYRPNTQAPSLG